jgi:hypothetical protein
VIAADEASRLEITRAIASGLEETAVGRRPPITVFRRHGPASRCCCAFHVALQDTREQPLWETLIGVLYEEAPDATAAARVRSTADVRSLIESAVGQMGPTLTAEMERLQASAAASLDAPIALALDRERAIAAALRMRRARLSAELLQPGLFDRRAERAAVAQDAVLDEAFSRCAARISNLMRSGPPYICRHRLAFGLIRR